MRVVHIPTHWHRQAPGSWTSLHTAHINTTLLSPCKCHEVIVVDSRDLGRYDYFINKAASQRICWKLHFPFQLHTVQKWGLDIETDFCTIVQSINSTVKDWFGKILHLSTIYGKIMFGHGNQSSDCASEIVINYEINPIKSVHNISDPELGDSGQR